MHKKLLLISVVICMAICSGAQRNFEAGLEYLRGMGKGYNTSRAAVRGEEFSNKSSFSAGITYVLPSGKAYSVSKGLGIYIGYRYSLGNTLTGNAFFGGARVLFSFENFEGQTNQNSLFITPWAELGYHFVFARHYFAAPSAGYGYTLKISKNYNSLQEDDGARIMPSLSAGYRF